MEDKFYSETSKNYIAMKRPLLFLIILLGIMSLAKSQNIGVYINQRDTIGSAGKPTTPEDTRFLVIPSDEPVNNNSYAMTLFRLRTLINAGIAQGAINNVNTSDGSGGFQTSNFFLDADTLTNSSGDTYVLNQGAVIINIPPDSIFSDYDQSIIADVGISPNGFLSRNSIWMGNGHTLLNNASNLAVFGDRNIVGDGVTFANGALSLVAGATNAAEAYGSVTTGIGARVQSISFASGSGFAHAFFQGSGSGVKDPTVPYVTARGSAFNVSYNNASQTDGFGALGTFSAILGGLNHNIPIGADNSIVLGGNTIVANTDPNTVWMPKLKIGQGTGGTLPAASAPDSLMTVASDGTVGFRAITSLPGAGGSVGGVNDLDVADGSGNFQATNVEVIGGVINNPTGVLGLENLEINGNTLQPASGTLQISNSGGNLLMNATGGNVDIDDDKIILANGNDGFVLNSTAGISRVSYTANGGTSQTTWMTVDNTNGTASFQSNDMNGIGTLDAATLNASNLNVIVNSVDPAEFSSYSAVFGTGFGIVNHRFGNVPIYSLAHANGGQGTESFAVINEAIGQLDWRPWDGTQYNLNATAYVRGVANEAHAATDLGTRLEFGVTADGAANATTQMTLNTDGLTVGTSVLDGSGFNLTTTAGNLAIRPDNSVGNEIVDLIGDEIVFRDLGNTIVGRFNQASDLQLEGNDLVDVANVTRNSAGDDMTVQNLSTNVNSDLSLIASGGVVNLQAGSTGRIQALSDFRLFDFIRYVQGSRTILSGAITAVETNNIINTEGLVSTDDLDNINGGTDGDIVFLRAANGANTVVVKDGTGNLRLDGDFPLDSTDDFIKLYFNGTNWLEMSRSDNDNSESNGGFSITTSAETTISTVDTPVKAAGTTATFLLSNFDDNGGTDNRLRYTGTETKTFRVDCTVSMTAASNNQNIGLYIAENGTVIANSEVRRFVSGGTDVGAASVSTLVSLATNDFIELWVENQTSTANMTVELCNCTVKD